MWIWKQIANGGIALMTGDGRKRAMTVDKNGSVTFPAGTDSGVRYRDVALTPAQVKALNATPITLVPAPGAGLANVFEGAAVFLKYGTAAYGGIAAGEDLSIKYTDGSGAEVAQCETTGFLDQTANALRYVRPQAAASGNSAITPVANAALVAHMLTGEITTGDSTVYVRVYYRVIPATF